MTPRADEFLVFSADDGRTRVEVPFVGDTVWLTQAGIADLYQTTPQNVTQHIAAIYEERELVEAGTCKPFFQARQEGARQGGEEARIVRDRPIAPPRRDPGHAASWPRAAGPGQRARRAPGVNELAGVLDEEREEAGVGLGHQLVEEAVDPDAGGRAVDDDAGALGRVRVVST